jgi:hypothetical protein
MPQKYELPELTKDIANIIYISYYHYKNLFHIPSVFLNGVISGMLSSSDSFILNPQSLSEAEARTELSTMKRMTNKAKQIKKDFDKVYNDRIQIITSPISTISSENIDSFVAPHLTNMSKLSSDQHRITKKYRASLSAYTLLAMKEISSFGSFLGSSLQNSLSIVDNQVKKEFILCLALVINFSEEIIKGVISLPIEIAKNTVIVMSQEVIKQILHPKTPTSSKYLEEQAKSFSDFIKQAQKSNITYRGTTDIHNEYINNYHTKELAIKRRSTNIIGHTIYKDGWHLSKTMLLVSDSIRAHIIGGTDFLFYKMNESSKKFSSHIVEKSRTFSSRIKHNTLNETGITQTRKA